MSNRRCVAAILALLLPLAGCATRSHSCESVSTEIQEGELTLGAGDALGVQIYAADLVLAAKAAERNPFASASLDK